MTTSHAPRYCSSHRSELAGWQCPQCKKMLCGKCTAKDYSGFYCVACEGRAEQFTIDRRSKPFERILFDAAIYPIRHVGLYVLALSLLLTVTSPLVTPDTDTASPCKKSALEKKNTLENDAVAEPSDAQENAAIESKPCAEAEPPTLGALALLTATLRVMLLVVLSLFVAGRVAHGNKAEAGTVRRLIQAAIGSFIVWGPGIAYLVLVHRGMPNRVLLQDELVWLFLGLAVLYVPMAVAATTAEVSYGEALSPFHVFHWAWQIWPRYLATTFVIILLCGIDIQIAIWLTARSENQAGAALLTQWPLQILFVCVLVMIFCVIGSVAHIYGYIFGWGKPELYRDPLFPRLRADGVLKKWAEQRAAIEKRAESSKDDAVKTPKEQGEAAQIRAIAQAIKTDNLNRALRAYEARPTWSANAFDDKQMLVLGTIAVRQKKPELGERILHELGSRRTFTAGRARITLAQMYEETLGQPEKAQALYQQVIDEFPGTDIAKIAERKLHSAK